jgi:hypothetical protein
MRSASSIGAGLQGGPDDTAAEADRGTSLNRDISMIGPPLQRMLAEVDQARVMVAGRR